MGFLDDLKKFFVTGDTFYPDNEKREARVNDLNKDCNDFLALYKTEAKNSRTLMGELNAKVGDLVKDGDLPAELQFALSDQVKETPYESMMNIYATLCMNPMIQTIWQTARALIHHQSLEELGKDLAITLGTAVAVQAGCMVFGGLAGFMVIGPINGARRRSKLREAIKEDVKCRDKIYSQYYILTLVDQHLQTVINALSAFESSGVLPNTIKDVVERKLDELKSAIKDENKLSKETKTYLQQHDQVNGSWTKEG